MREVWGDRVLAARPLRVVHDGEDHRSFFFVPGTAWKNDPRDHGEVRFLDGPWELEDLVRERPVLSFEFPGRAYAVLLTWSPSWTFEGYYVNLQTPLRPWALGFDYVDHFLDVLDPARSGRLRLEGRGRARRGGRPWLRDGGRGAGDPARR